MAQTNQKTRAIAGRTHEGAPAMKEQPLARLARVLNAHLLWENSFYMDGQASADALRQAVLDATAVDASGTAGLIVQARTEMKIRHASLMAAVIFASLRPAPGLGRILIRNVIQRADELAEVIAMAQRNDGKVPHAVLRGVRDAFARFDEYQFAKYRGEGKAVTLRDAVFMSHPDPTKIPLIQKIVDETLETPNTWETRLSSGEDKCAAFSDLLHTNSLGAMALLRNLRGMAEAGVNRALVVEAMEKANWSRVLPFRFMSAASAAPGMAKELDKAFRQAVSGSVYLKGKTAVLVDTSGSMAAPISAKSTVHRHHAGAVLAAAINGDQVDLYQWADRTASIPNFGGLSGAFSISNGRVGHGTNCVQAVEYAMRACKYDRVIVISDMQFHEGGSFGASVPTLPEGVKGYTINVGPYGNPGLVQGDWTHFTGFSEAVLTYIAAEENAG